MAAQQEPTIDKLRKLCEEVEGRLLENEDYQIYVALKKTIEDYEYHKRELENAVEGKAAPKSGLGRRAAKHLSQREATAMVLEEAKQPMAIETLLPRLQEMGVIFRAKSPKASLSAQLSSSESFQVVEFGGRRCWWFAGRPIP